MPPSPC